MIDLERVERLRVRLHQVIDEELDQVKRAVQQPRQNTEEETKLSIVPGNNQEGFTYTFPGNERVAFSGGRWYKVEGPHGQVKMLLAHGEVDIWRGRREVYYIFARESGPENPLTTFECT